MVEWKRRRNVHAFHADATSSGRPPVQIWLPAAFKKGFYGSLSSRANTKVDIRPKPINPRYLKPSRTGPSPWQRGRGRGGEEKVLRTGKLAIGDSPSKSFRGFEQIFSSECGMRGARFVISLSSEEASVRFTRIDYNTESVDLLLFLEPIRQRFNFLTQSLRFP